MLPGTTCCPCCVSRRSAKTSRTAREAQNSPMTRRHASSSPTPLLTAGNQMRQGPYRRPTAHQPRCLRANAFWRRRRADSLLSSQDHVGKKRRERRKSRTTEGEIARCQAPHLPAKPLPRARKAHAGSAVARTSLSSRQRPFRRFRAVSFRAVRRDEERFKRRDEVRSRRSGS
jgi:hypothetical protein